MAHVIHGPLHGVSLGQADAEKSADGTRRTLLTGTTIAISIVVLLLVALTAYFVSSRSSHSAVAPSHAAPIAAKATSLAQPAAPLSAAELKAVKGRDDYALSLSRLLHQKLPEYKQVAIYADNWAGTHAPTISAPRDAKARTGDNLMMVFWSPDRGTARSLADFTKSKAAQEAANFGYEEFQFVDPSTYCFALVAPNTGVGPVTCGIR